MGIGGTLALLGLNPEMMPSPPSSATPSAPRNGSSVQGTHEALGGLVGTETIEIGVWIASVLFCSCVCFGNIGRKLALKRNVPVVRLRRDSFQ